MNSNGNLIGFVLESFCGWLSIAIDDWVRLNVLSPRIIVAADPNVHDDVVSTSAWYCFKHTRNLVLQLPKHNPLIDCFSLQHRFRLLTPLSFRKDFNFNSNKPEHVIWNENRENNNNIKNGVENARWINE